MDKNKPRVVFQDHARGQTFRYVQLPVPDLVTGLSITVEKLAADALGNEIWVRINFGNKEEAQLALALVVEQLAKVKP